MKQFIKYFCAIVIFGLAQVAESKACIVEPNFEAIFKEIKATERISQAMLIRQKYLGQMCNLRDLAKLATYEGGGYFSEKYRNTLSRWITDKAAQFATAQPFNETLFVLSDELIPRLTSIGDQILLRRELLVAVRDCKDLTRLSYAWVLYPSKALQEELNLFFAQYEPYFCWK